MDIFSIDGFEALTTYDSNKNLNGGFFIGVNCWLDFYGETQNALIAEANLALCEYFSSCKELGERPQREISIGLKHTLVCSASSNSFTASTIGYLLGGLHWSMVN